MKYVWIESTVLFDSTNKKELEEITRLPTKEELAALKNPVSIEICQKFGCTVSAKVNGFCGIHKPKKLKPPQRVNHSWNAY